MKEILLIKNGELALKGLNRSTFEDILIKNLRRKLSGILECDISKSQSTIYVVPTEEDPDMDAAVEAVSKVFGIARFSRAVVAPKNMQQIIEVSGKYLKDQLAEVKTFKVEAKRADKNFPMKSPEISRELGGYLLKNNPHLKVDVHHPDLCVTVEVREKYAYIHGTQLFGAGGMPVGTAGRAAILLSGGIDSPVAAYMMAKRGVNLVGIHFASPPYTSPRAEQKVHELASEVAEYAGRIPLFVVPFTEIQEHIKDDCPEDSRSAARSSPASPSVRSRARPCTRSSAPTPSPTCPSSVRPSAWTRPRSSRSPGRSAPSRPPSSPTKTAARSSHRSIRGSVRPSKRSKKRRPA